MKFILTGFMGSGKSFIGKQLADTLQLPFYDLDACIESYIGHTIADYFETNGEAAFRSLEKDCLTQILNKNEDLVLSTGGGSPCFFDNMQQMNQAGLTIFLNPPAETLAQRLLPELKKRPVLKGQTETSLIEFIISLRANRMPFYAQAEMTITDPEPEVILGQITAALSKR